MIPPLALWTLRQLMTGEPLNGEADALPEPFRRVVRHLDGLSVNDRPTALRGFLAAGEDAEADEKALFAIDPNSPPPVADLPEPCATLADVQPLISSATWIWPGWLAPGVLSALAANPGVGKTIMALDLSRRLWLGLAMPDGQPNPFPAGTRTLWVPGDSHYAQLLDMAPRYGLPLDAILLNAPKSDPTGGLDLDDRAELDALKGRILAEDPGLVFIDTVGMTTDRNLGRPEEARSYFGPLMAVALETGKALVLLTHLSKDNEALGRRIVGACRTVVKMTAPDPEGQRDRRRVWVDKSFAEKPPALGMTITATHCDFDFNPPSAPEPSKGGRVPKEREAAEAFIREALGNGADRIGNELARDWEAKTGHSDRTFWRAVKDLKESGEIATEGGKGTRRQTVLRLCRPDDAEPEPEGF